MLQTFDALRKVGVDVEKMDFWDQDDSFDIVHLWGLEMAHLNTVLWAKKKGKKVVITALLNYMETPKEKIYNLVSSHIDKVKFLKRIAGLVDSLVVLNTKQKQVAIKYYNSHPEKTQIIPIIINSDYYNYRSNGKNLFDNLNDFILTTGNICERKNQYNLAQACMDLKKDLLIIGNALEGEQAYAQKLEKLIGQSENIKWIKGVNVADDILLEAYKTCSAFALPSFAEVQPTSALEAAIAAKPLLLADKEYAHQEYFKGAELVDPSSVDDIKKGIRNVLNSPSHKQSVECSVLDEFREEIVGQKYFDLYRSLL
jgi:glycosyltransferase involved in cell wall biosynthesis